MSKNTELNKQIHIEIMGAKWRKVIYNEQKSRYAQQAENYRYLLTDEHAEGMLGKFVEADFDPAKHFDASVIPDYLSEISEVWKVIKKMESKRFKWMSSRDYHTYSFVFHKIINYDTNEEINTGFVIAESWAEAICKAALRTLEGA